MKRILIIEDDPAIAKGLTDALNAEAFETICAADGQSGFAKARNEPFDLVILDILLPLKNGIDVCRELRAAGVNVPVLMLTSKTEEIDKVIGLEIGADDYVTKPFSIRELIARIKALLRRAAPEAKPDTAEYIAFGTVQLDFHKQLARKGGELLKLSAKEFEILRFFIRHEGEVVTRDMLLDSVWGYDIYPTTRTVDNYILSLRKKIEDNPAAPRHLLTVHTSGYRFVAAPPEEK